MDHMGGSLPSGSPDFMLLDMADPIPLRDLEARLRRLAELDEDEQWREAKDLIEVSKASLQLFRDTVIAALTRDHTYEDVAKRFEISVKTVEASVTRYNKRQSQAG